MKLSFLLGAVLAMSAPRLTAAEAPPTGPVPVGTVALAKKEELKGTITLPNHNTLLFIPTPTTNKVRVVAIGPHGAPAWEATLAKAQQIREGGLYGTSVLSESVNTLLPLFLTSVGNTVYSVESVTDAPASSGLPRYALLVQALSATGQVAGRAFAAPAPPDKTERLTITTFAEDDAVYALMRESNVREKTSQLFLDRCDLRTGKLTHTALPLPAPAPLRKAEGFDLNWVFAGLRAGTCYFYRALKGSDPKTDARGVPVEFEVKLLATDGHEMGGFTTTLHQHLPPNAFVQGATSFPHHGLAMAPSWLAATDKQANQLSSFRISTGGNCEFFLDEATGDCLFAGQYTNQVYRPQTDGVPSQGTFVQRYSPTGTLVKTAIAPYALLKGFDADLLMTKAYMPLMAAVLRSPQNQELTFHFRAKESYVVSTYDAQLTPAPQQLVPMVESRGISYGKQVYWSGPSYLESFNKTTGAAQPFLSVDVLRASPTALHRKIGELVQAEFVGARSPGFHYYVAALTGPGSALVFAFHYRTGEPISVFEVK
jgi:hypothetical protein